METKQRIREFIIETFLFGADDANIEDGESLLESGVVVAQDGEAAALTPALTGCTPFVVLRDAKTRLQEWALARGLPSGSDLEYADDSTLAHALESRAEVHSSGNGATG